MNMLKIACKITGDDYQMLASETPSSKKKVIVLATSVFVPAIMWFFNGLLLTACVMEKPLWSAIMVGLGMGLVIFLIEKLVVMSNGGKVLAWFRGFLAFFVAILGSVFLDETFFAKDIDQQVAINKDRLIEQRQNEVSDRYSDRLDSLAKVVEGKYSIWQTSREAAEKEADGSGGSGVKGVDAITMLKLKNAGINQADYMAAKAELDTLDKRVQHEQKVVNDATISTFENKALLVRIKAMFNLAFSDVYLLVFHAVVTIILFLLEFLVIIFKITMKKTNYELRLELIEEIGRKRMDKVRQHDLQHFEPGCLNYESKLATKAINQQKSVSLFN